MQTEPFSACTSILIGKNATVDGSVIIGRNEDSRPAWPKNFVVHPAVTHDTPQVFKSQDNDFSMPLPANAAKYTATPEWTTKYGLFEEDGINEYGVAMSATESTYANTRVLAADPLEKNGIGEEAMITVTLPYIKSAREGVKRLGTIVATYGTDESNGILFADKDEAWYFETGSGHYWVAQRIPDDSYAVIANQMAIQEIDFADPDNFMWHPGIQDFVKEHALNPGRQGFNFRKIFGTANQMDTYYNLPRVWYGQKMFNPAVEQSVGSYELPFLRQADDLLSVDDAKAFLSSHYQGTEYDPIGNGDEADRKRFRPVSLATTQESHILQLRQFAQPELSGIHWLAMGVAAQSVYVPFYAGILSTPAAYQASDVVSYQAESAYWVYKQAGVMVDSHYREFRGQLSDLQKDLNQKFGQAVIEADNVGRELDGVELSAYLTKISTAQAELGLKKYRELTADLITKATAFSPLKYKQDLNL